ncbi:hypothetical protein HCAG_01669 [Histoplasma mississippiense (nom. inval.)]|uniref:hypothetical protein n=1 Tax=Ajellomyces capsulatus (strain NAm1 / WU24) TaxID=2059318 RepID=UPI000157B9CB|nr:hypothetical protein HCAG_01669 [Histoplasma mississippiense (nom. inval.)]EDN03804.1 hypothetical protein HCAG_01669 [Histoplasma mississippiense (nom. inval.)]
MTIGLKKWAVSLCARALLLPIVAAVKITSRMTGSCGKKALREEIEDGVLKLSQLIHSLLRPLPTQTGDGTYVDETPPEPSLIDDLNQVDIKDLETLADVIRNAATGAPVNDKDYIMERIIRLPSSLPSRSPNVDRLSNALLSLLWNDLKHPPLSYLGEQTSFGHKLALQVLHMQGLYHRSRSNQQCSQIRGSFSIIYSALTAMIIHLAPLYGSNQEEQNTVRTFKGGKLKPDCFSEKRILGFPPGVGVLLIMFNRFHNYVVENLALINQDNRFPKPAEPSGKAYAKYDNDLFQTGRLITCGLYINIILKDYLRTILNINRTDSDWSLDPRSESMRGLFGTAIDEAGGNQVSAEFNLVYRWHSCVSERDDKWTQNAYRELFGDGMDPNKISLSDFLRVLGKWEAGLSKDPLKRPFAKLARGSNGLFNDDDLANILTESIEDCAGPFGTSQIPAVFRAVEILGINQARHGDFRASTNNVELYPGPIAEEAKESLVPGSGLCANFTISRAILSDAVALVRGDRFYTVDQTPKNLTNWGFNEASYDNTVDKGHVFYKLFLRAFPSHFKPNSIYAHFPLVVPDENREILTRLNSSRKYSWDKPARIPRPTMIESYAACDAIIKNQKDFKVTWGEAIEFLMHKECHSFGRDFMLSGDEPPNAASRQMMGRALYHGEWEAEVKKFYEQITLKLLHAKSYKIAGVNQVDIVRDVANIAQVHFAVAVFGLPLKTGDNPRGIYTESELYMIMALVFACIFFDADPAKSFPLRQRARKVTQQLGDIVLLNVQLIKQTGFLSNMVERLYGNNMLTEYGVHMIRRLLDSGLPPEQIVWTHMLPTAGGMVANQAQLFSQCLDYYLSEEGSIHLPEIHRLSKLGTAEADELLLKYFLEGSRLRATVGVYREVVTQSTIKDGVKTLSLKPGDRVACNFAKASMDPKKFPEPDKVDLTRDLDSYIHFGQGPHKCLGFGICNAALSTMLKTVGKLENLRRAPGPQGELRRIPGPGGISKYLVVDYTSYFPFPTTMKVQWDGELPPCAN